MITPNNAELTTQQSEPSRTPYVHLVFENQAEDDTEDISTDGTYGNRILLIDHTEEVYDDFATIVLQDVNRDIPALRGWHVDIGYGDSGGGLTGTDRYVDRPRLWVKSQQRISMGGKKWTVLYLEGGWAKLNETLLLNAADLPYQVHKTADSDFNGQTTPYDIISWLMEQAGMSALAALAEDDSIMDTFTPDFKANEPRPFEYVGSVIYRLVRMTKSYLRWSSTALQAEVKYPQSSDSADFTVYSSQSPYFYEFVEQQNVVIPNYIICYGNEGPDGLWVAVLTSSASNGQDAVSQGLYGIVYGIELAGELTSQGDVNARADVAIIRAKAEMTAGILVMPHDCRIQLFDKSQIVDSR